MPRAAFLLLLLPSVALGQVAAGSIQITETADTETTPYINIAECSGATADGLVLTFTVSGSPALQTGYKYKIEASNESGCTSTGAGGTKTTLANIDATVASSVRYPVGTGSIAVPSVVKRSPLDIACNVETSLYFCVTLTDSAGTAVTSGTFTAAGSIAIDGLTPATPVASSLSVGDAALTVSWSAGTGVGGTAASYKAVATAQGDPGDVHEQTSTSGTSIRVDGLTNGRAYDVLVIAYSKGGNPSAQSNTLTGTPLEVDDFWRLYRKAGGQESGGCGGGGGGILALLLVLTLAVRGLRGRRA